MTPRDHDAYTYMGLLDDSAQRYPWRFKVDAAALNHLLLIELINGKPLLLNDGYLVNNDLVRASLMQREGLLWELLRNGFVRVLARGGDKFGLAELPPRMAKRIPSFDAIVKDRVAGVRWKDLQRALLEVDELLRISQGLVPWPSLDAGSGFLALVENLRERKVTPHVLGIGRHVGKRAMTSLLDEIASHLERDTSAARTVWETAVLKMAAKPDYTNAPDKFKLALMNLANEMYHYNMGILLSKDFGANVSVQTQTSAAFDDLLVPPSLKFLLEELPSLPRLHVPRAIAQVDPILLASIVIPGSGVFDARHRWLELRASWENASALQRAAMAAGLRDAGDEYAKRLSQFVGGQIKYKEAEELLEYVIGAGLNIGAGAAAATVLVAAGAPATAVAAGTLGGLALGYAVTRGRKKALGGVFKKFRVEAIEKSLKLPPSVAGASDRVMNLITRRQVPSTLQIAPSVVTALAPRLKAFKYES